MRSYVCEFSFSEVLRSGLKVLVPVLLFIAGMHLGAWRGWLPAPRPALDVDLTILIAKAEAARRTNDAEVVLLGDSSCLMDVSALRLGETLGRSVLNLGTLSYVDLPANGLLIRKYVETNPGRLRYVVLLMHPDSLRLPQRDTWQNQVLRSILQGSTYQRCGQLGDPIRALLAIPVFQECLLARALPIPLPGSFGRRYGFTWDLERYLKHNRGSAIDPESKPPTGLPEYWLAGSLKPACRAFLGNVPEGVELFVALTPLPENYAGARYPVRQAELLGQWSEWLSADAPLTNAPAVMSDGLFAQKTHLNEAGQLRYTEDLARALGPLMHRASR